MNRWKAIFKILKDAGINSMFQEFNRHLVLGISTGDATPKSPDTIDDIMKEIQKHRNELKHSEGNIESDDEFIRGYIGHCESYRHYFIDIPSYGTVIDYFTLNGYTEKSKTPAQTMMSTILDREDNKFVVHAIIVVLEDHECVSDDSLGKIVKHELTHVLLEVMEFVLGINIHGVVESEEIPGDESEEFRAFQEFLCDYIQCDSMVGPTEHPVAKFREIMKTHLTWVASDLYEPYLQAVEEYYADEKKKEEQAGEN